MSETSALKAIDALLYDEADGYHPDLDQDGSARRRHAGAIRKALWARWRASLDADMKAGRLAIELSKSDLAHAYWQAGYYVPQIAKKLELSENTVIGCIRNGIKRPIRPCAEPREECPFP